ncbi:vWA domain-containing protein [Bifidobacterium avesanii]|uniref:VWA domain-containing protein n=1 Tax=Bifidobacterium avesanii TaxID=1798157 RepID=A0A7K3TEV4_9BIFI|nr:vWA domain-containing protein [Bifidobacterium avesanii]KAB8295621.1 VWA domain-containing protein [Bifidobacterium avesanii]NEG77625.1 VWA domain-containing protein [Bifidobacterium avesanii]
MNDFTFSPALGWVAGPVVAGVLVVAGIAYAVWFARHRADTDAGAAACVRRVLAALVLAAMVMTPGMRVTTTSRAVNATDVFIAVDVTGSMAVDDANYGTDAAMSRLNAARAVVRDVTRLYPDASYAAVSFGVTGTLDVPLTPDGRAIENWAATLATESTGVSAGSNLDAPIDRLLVAAKAAKDQHPDDTVVLYLITDGEQTSGKTRRTFSSLRMVVDDAFVIGVGSAQGGNIPVSADAAQGAQAGQWVIDPTTGQPGVSKLDEANLTAIADELSGTYEHMDATHTLESGASAKTSRQYRLTTTAKERTRMAPVVWPLAFALLALLIWEAGAWLATSRRLI